MDDNSVFSHTVLLAPTVPQRERTIEPSFQRLTRYEVYVELRCGPLWLGQCACFNFGDHWCFSKPDIALY